MCQIHLAELPKTNWKVYLDDLCKHLTLKHQKHEVLLSKGNMIDVVSWEDGNQVST